MGWFAMTPRRQAQSLVRVALVASLCAIGVMRVPSAQQRGPDAVRPSLRPGEPSQDGRVAIPGTATFTRFLERLIRKTGPPYFSASGNLAGVSGTGVSVGWAIQTASSVCAIRAQR